MYNVLLLFHILAAIAWVGGGLTNQLAVAQARKRGGSQEADHQIMGLEWMETYIYIPAPILVLLTGVSMVFVSEGWRFSQPWVYLSLGLLVVAGVLGGAVGGRIEKRITDLRAQGAVESAPYAETLQRMLSNGWLELVILAGLVSLMVFKPGI